MPKRYPSDVSDQEWALVQEYFCPPRPKGGRPRKHAPRHLLNGIFYVMRQGCGWRALPDSFPPWQTVFRARMCWMENGALQRALEALARA